MNDIHSSDIVLHEVLRGVVEDSGIWRGDRRQSHGFLLSPDVYTLSEAKRQELERLGNALGDCMLGLSHIAVVANDPALKQQAGWSLASQVLDTGVPHHYIELQRRNIKHVPGVLKVDIMVNSFGNLKIAEIDGHNKHGLGYATLCARLRSSLRENTNALPGVVATLAEAIKARGHTTLKVLYGDQERFYLPEFELAAEEFERHGVNCLVVSELVVDEACLREGLFLDLPFLYKRAKIYDTIVPAYKEGRVEFIIPPKPFFGAKAVLALLRNDTENEHLQSVLRAFINRESLALVRSYIPETFLVGGHKRAMKSADVVTRLSSQKQYVLKRSVSSGMKGVYFSDEPGFSETLFALSLRQTLEWVMQAGVKNQPHTLSWFGNEPTCEPKLQTADDWNLRLIVQYVGRKLSDVFVTAKQNRAVHGGKNAIFLGTVIK